MATVREVTVSLQKYDLGIAADKLSDFVWNDFCDWYIELSKPALYGDDAEKRKGALSVLLYVLDNALRLLHPFIPFVTEEIYGYLPESTAASSRRSSRAMSASSPIRRRRRRSRASSGSSRRCAR